MDAGGGFSNPQQDAAGPPPFDAAGAPDAPPAVEPVLLETLTIDVTTSDPVRSTVVLLTGRSYRLVASGVATVRDDELGQYSGDADYYWNGVIRGDSFGGVDLGMAVNDFDGDASRSPDWGAFADAHVYEATVGGNDSVLTAQFFDNNHNNGNSGSLTLEIWGPPP